MGLGDLTLYSNGREGEPDDASVADYDQIKHNSLLPFKIEGRKIKVDMTQFDFFVTLMTNLTKSPLSIDNFRNKLNARKEYLGIEWVACDGLESIGCFKSDDIYRKLSGYYNGHC